MINEIEAQVDEYVIPPPPAERDIPPPPSGGSWTFDPVKWDWVSNEPADQPAVLVKE